MLRRGLETRAGLVVSGFHCPHRIRGLLRGRESYVRVPGRAGPESFWLRLPGLGSKSPPPVKEARS